MRFARFFVIGAAFAAVPVSASEPEMEWSCKADMKLAEGQIMLIRSFGDGPQAGDESDTVLWWGDTYNPGAPTKPVEFTMIGSWPLNGDAKVDLDVSIYADQATSSLGYFRLRRPAEDPYAMDQRLSLISDVFLSGSENGSRLNTLQIALDDVIAYSKNAGELEWTLGRNDAGEPIASGQLSVQPLRDAIAALPELRAQLNEKSKAFATQCEKRPKITLPPRAPFEPIETQSE